MDWGYNSIPIARSSSGSGLVDCGLLADDQLRVIYANEALTRMGHFELEDIQGRTPDAIFPSEDLPYIKGQHESGHRYGRHRSEFYLPRKDGSKIPAIFSGRVIQGPDKQDYVLLTVTDISAQKGVEEQLRESNSLLQKRQDEMEAELALAAYVQQSLAPHSLIWKNLAVEAYYSPARTIGGDFGVVLPQGDDFLNIVVSDVSGHGVGSALMANRIYSETLHALGRKTDPGALLREIHDFVHTRIPVDGFVFTMTAARFSKDGRRVSFSAAGQPPQYSSQMALSVCLKRETESLVASPKLRRPGLRRKLILSLATAWFSTQMDSSKFLTVSMTCSAWRVCKA